MGNHSLGVADSFDIHDVPGKGIQYSGLLTKNVYAKLVTISAIGHNVTSNIINKSHIYDPTE